MKNQYLLVPSLFSLAMGIAFVSNASLAGQNEVGNGGKGVYCPESGGGKKLYTLDFVRAEVEWQKQVKHVQGSNEIEKALNLISRIQSLDPYRTYQYKQAIIEFYSHVEFRDGIELQKTKDSNEWAICPGGEVVQVIWLSLGSSPWLPKKMFTIHRERWNQYDSDQKAIAIVHETILVDGAKYALWKFADPAMWMTALIASDDFANYNQDQYDLLLQNPSIGLPVLRENKLLEHLVSLRSRFAAVMEYKYGELKNKFPKDGWSKYGSNFGWSDGLKIDVTAKVMEYPTVRFNIPFDNVKQIDLKKGAHISLPGFGVCSSWLGRASRAEWEGDFLKHFRPDLFIFNSNKFSEVEKQFNQIKESVKPGGYLEIGCGVRTSLWKYEFDRKPRYLEWSIDDVENSQLWALYIQVVNP